MHKTALLLYLSFATTSVAAQDAPIGCFVRDYSQTHLDQHPEQIVDRISILFSDDDGAYVNADVQVLLANQGHAARDGIGGTRTSESAADFNGPLKFGVECDGGGFDVVALDGDSITIETQGMRLSVDGCNGDTASTTLLEANSTSTRYTLYKAELAVCQW